MVEGCCDKPKVYEGVSVVTGGRDSEGISIALAIW